MTKLRVIDCIKKEKPDYFLLYSNAYINALVDAVEKFGDLKNFDLDARRRIVWSGVKMMIASTSRSNDYRGATDKLALIQDINGIAGGLTPNEFQTIFPIVKSYDGEKYGTKDYFYTKKYIKEFGEDKVIGDSINEFLMEYDNWTVRFFVMQMMSAASDLREMEGGKGIMEEFLEGQGITTYTKSQDHQGKEILINNDTGEVTKVNKPRPRHLKVIK